jgi:hypothetical protein
MQFKPTTVTQGQLVLKAHSIKFKKNSERHSKRFRKFRLPQAQLEAAHRNRLFPRPQATKPLSR